MAGDDNSYSIVRRLTNVGSVLLAVLFIATGAILLFGIGHSDAKGPGPWVLLLRDFGSLLVVTGVFTIIWELVGRRALFDEFWSKAQLAESIRAAGLGHVAESFRTLDWVSLLRHATRLDIFFSYGRTWRNAHSESLEALLRRPDGRIRVVLPDPDNSEIVSELARRFQQTGEQVATAIREGIASFSSLRTDTAAGERLEIWVVPFAPVFSCYRVDQKAVFALYRHRAGRGPVPAFVVDSGGYLYDFIREEFNVMLGGARRIV